MPSEGGEFSIAEDGTVTLSAAPIETNAVVWSPVLPTAFDKARNATMFTRLGTRHSRQELKAAFEATPDINQTFYLSVNNVILVFSGSRDEHTMHCHKILEMLQAHSMRANINDCVFYSENITDTGIRLERIRRRRAYLVINERAPRLRA